MDQTQQAARDEYHSNMREFNALVDQFKTTTDIEARFRIMRRQNQLIEELDSL